MDMGALQAHTIEAIRAMDATHPDAAAEGAPHVHVGPVEGAHDPSGASAIRENLEVGGRGRAAGATAQGTREGWS
jgi:hypothetical protein